jgi:hypothetical protein
MTRAETITKCGSGALYGELLLIVAAAGAWWLACAYEDELIAVS